MPSNPRSVRKHFNMLSDETRHSVLPADVNLLIESGKLEKDGNWYRVYDLKVLSNELYGLIRRILISRNETLIQLY